MREIAVEFNLSETTFVLEPTVPDAAWWLRSFTPSGDEVVGAGMRQGAARVGPTVDIQEGLSAALGRAVGHLEPGTGPCVVSTGVAHLMAAVADREILWQLTPDAAPLARVLESVGAQGCYVFTRDTVDPSAHAHARFFNPTVGIREDPATGSAAGPLAALLFDRGEVGPGSTVVIEQGFAMGRPSRLDVRVDHGQVELAGSCVVVGEGVLHL